MNTRTHAETRGRDTAEYVYVMCDQMFTEALSIVL
jgi:hypothetical protein